MGKSKIVVVLIAMVVFEALCGINTINPANYIWIDYQNTIPVSYKGNGNYQSGLPCASRIGKCSYDFSVLPPGWSATRDGTLTIPQSDALKNGIFAIQGEFSEVTGEKISADLIVKIDNGLLSVIDKAEYFQKNGYSLQSEDSTTKTTKYEDSILVKNLPDGFAPITQLERRILDGDISNITTIINEVLSQYAPCRSMINYLGEVKGMLSRIINNNNQQIKIYNDNVKQLELNLKNLQDKKQQQLLRQEASQEIVSVKKSIDLLSEEIVKQRFNESIYKEQAKKNMDTLNKYPIKVQTLNSADLKGVLADIVRISKDLESNYNQMIGLKKSVLAGKLKKQMKDIPANFSYSIETAYTKNSQVLANNLIYLINNEVKTNNTLYLQAETSGFLAAVNKKLDSMNTVVSADSETVKQIQAENALLMKNIDSLTTVGKYAQMNCK